jgi:hypothetical protein
MYFTSTLDGLSHEQSNHSAGTNFSHDRNHGVETASSDGCGLSRLRNSLLEGRAVLGAIFILK